MQGLKVSPQYPKGRANRAIFCSRTLNLRSIQAIGIMHCIIELQIYTSQQALNGSLCCHAVQVSSGQLLQLLLRLLLLRLLVIKTLT